MKQQPEWMYDEYRHCGVDYDAAATVAAYDRRHEDFRDFAAEAAHIKELLGLSAMDRIIDMGAGTGALTVHLAKDVQSVCAVDVSEPMLSECRQKCATAGLNNVAFHQGGFLSYVHAGEQVDALISQTALHHLPDMWKQVALLRCFDMLKPGGQLLLIDVVFSFPVHSYDTAIQEWVDGFPPETMPQAVTHIKSEHSTFDWVMQGMLDRTGFLVEKVEDRPHSIKAYVCRKPAC